MWTAGTSPLTMSVYNLPAQGLLDESDTAELIQFQMVTLSLTRP
jgi:hypothetical protein